MGQGFSRMLQTVSPDMTMVTNQSPHNPKKLVIRDDHMHLTRTVRRNSGSKFIFVRF